jgi:hypothetical protein
VKKLGTDSRLKKKTGLARLQRTVVRVFTIVSLGLTLLTSLSAWPIASVNAEGSDENLSPTAQEEKISISFINTGEISNEKEPEVLGLQEMDLENKQADINSYYSGLESQYAEILRLRKEADKLVNYLRRQGSPVANYDHAYQIIKLSEANGADYRVIVAIMGMESGFCRANYKKYNCFGFLNGVQYAGFTEAFNHIIPQVARMYAKPFGTNFAALAKAYGVHNVEYHAPRMHMFYSALL